MYSPVQVLSSGDIVVLEKPDYYLIGRIEPRAVGKNDEPFWLDTSIDSGDADRRKALTKARGLAGDHSVFLRTSDGALLQLHNDVDLRVRP